MAKSKLIDEVIQDDVEVSEEAVAPKDEYVIPELKEEDKRQDPGHSRRDFRN